LFYAIALMRCWAGLHPEETQRMIDVGVNLMMKTAMCLVRRRIATPISLRIPDVLKMTKMIGIGQMLMLMQAVLPPEVCPKGTGRDSD
jgi:hypothetical protein